MAGRIFDAGLDAITAQRGFCVSLRTDPPCPGSRFAILGRTRKPPHTLSSAPACSVFFRKNWPPVGVEPTTTAVSMPGEPASLNRRLLAVRLPLRYRDHESLPVSPGCLVSALLQQGP